MSLAQASVRAYLRFLLCLPASK